MTDSTAEYRLTIRLPAALYTALAACGAPGQPLSALVRQALTEYIARQTDRRTSAEEAALTLADIAARLQAVEVQVATLTARLTPRADMADTLQQTRADMADTLQQTRADMADTLQADGCPPFDPARSYLGKLCPRGHEWGTTGQSLLRRSNQRCRQCENQQRREQRVARRQPS